MYIDLSPLGVSLKQGLFLSLRACLRACICACLLIKGAYCSKFIERVSKVTLRDFMEDFNNIAEQVKERQDGSLQHHLRACVCG